MLSCFGIDPGATELNGSCALGHISTLGELCRTCLDWKQDPQIPGITQLEASFILVVFPNTSEQPGKIIWLVSNAHPSDKEHYFKCHPSVKCFGRGDLQVAWARCRLRVSVLEVCMNRTGLLGNVLLSFYCDIGFITG